MPEYRYEWEIILAGHGPNADEAWENCLESFMQDKHATPEHPQLLSRELIDADAYPGNRPDETPVEVRPQDKLWLIWSNEHGMWWKPAKCGYTPHRKEAGRYNFDEAVQICRDANKYQRWEHYPAPVPNETMIPED